MSNNLIVANNQLDVMTLGEVLSNSGYFQDASEAAQAVVKVLAGQELGFGPVASMTGINIIKGRVSLSANLIAAAIKRSGRYNYRVKQLTDAVCEVIFYEDGQEVGTSQFTIQDAKAAGLGGDNWRKYPRNMLFARAVSNGAKWYCPDIFGGPVYTPDELGAEVDGETGEVITFDPPKPEPPAQQPAKTNGKPANGAPKEIKPRTKSDTYKFPNSAAERFYNDVQAAAGNYYQNPHHLLQTLGGKWFNFGDNDLRDERLSYAVDHARSKEAGNPEPQITEDEVPF